MNTETPSIGTIMLIDDDEFDQLVYSRVISKSGLATNVLTFLMAEDALAYLRRPDRKMVDVIFLDINMPRMSGFDFLEQAIKEFGTSFSKMVVVMLTTSLDPRDISRAKTFDVVHDYLEKPLSEDQLRQIAHMLHDKAAD